MGIGDWGLGIGDWPIPNPQYFLIRHIPIYILYIYKRIIITIN